MAIYRQSEIDGDIFTPRSYQLELVDKAKNGNIIVPLGTGVGKTFIAVMLIKEMAEDVRETIDKGGKRSFFLVDKVPLVAQQAAHIRSHTNLTVGECHGWNKSINVWGKDQWRLFLIENQAIVMTAQIFYDLLNHGFMTLAQVNVIIFDECHHATKSHPYRLIMKHYVEADKDNRPKILGLTASIVNERCDPSNLENAMQNLEMALCSRIETSSDLMTISKFGAKPRIKQVNCPDTDKKEPLYLKCRQILSDALQFCRNADFDPEFDIDPTKPVIESLKKTIAVLDELGLYCMWKVCPLQEKHLKKFDKVAMLPEQSMFYKLVITALTKVRKMLETPMLAVNSMAKAQPYLVPKLYRLLEVLKYEGKMLEKKRREQQQEIAQTLVADVHVVSNKKSESAEFSCLVFVQQRYIAYVLRMLLKDAKRWDQQSFGFLKADYVIGYSGYNISTDEQITLHRRQEDVLKKFRNRNLNLLCATSVLEEGVDVRQCNIVIRFDVPADFRSYVQSKGRARKQGSVYYVLVEKQFNDSFLESLKKFQKIEAILLRHCCSREDPDPEQVIPEMADQLMAPYYVDVTGKADIHGKPRVTMSTSIALVNRYCAKLPSDIFTRLVPRSTIEALPDGDHEFFQATLLLPINSPIKREITGPRMPSKKYAQMAVALEVCKILHKEGELDDHLLPMGKESAAEKLPYLLGDDDEDEVWSEDGRARAGSTKRKLVYPKKIADVFMDAKPDSKGGECYLHLIEIKMNVPASQTTTVVKNRKVLDPADSLRCFGILSTKHLPNVPAFPLYTRQGEVLCRIHTLPNKVYIEAGQLILITKFHQYLFSDILHLDKSSMTWDPDGSRSTVFLVPLLRTVSNTYDLDYAFVCKITLAISELPRQPDNEEREKFIFDREKYIDSVVMPWYRNNDQPHFYYVAEISQNFKPSSAFPDSQFSSFNEYFMQKYGLVIYNQEQNLLDVDYTSNRLNLLIPRYVNRRGQSLQPAETRAPTVYNQKQILVPELVDIHPIAGSMWNMIVCLPSALHRLNSLLLANELRERILNEAFTPNEPLTQEPQWEPLDYGWQKNLDAYVESYRGDGTDVTYSVAESDAYEKNYLKSSIGTAGGGNSASGVDGNFEIGVWDPNAVDLSENEIWKSDFQGGGIVVNGVDTVSVGDALDPNKVAAPSRPLAADVDSGDEWEAEDDIYFDMEFSRQVMKMERRTGKVTNGDVHFPDPFKPADNIVPTGWETASSAPMVLDGANLLLPMGGNGALAGGLQFLSTGNDMLDAAGLMMDLADVEQGGKTPMATMDNDSAAAGVVEQDEQEGEALRKLKKIRIDDREYDDVDHVMPEESLDLTDLINFRNDLPDNLPSMTSSSVVAQNDVQNVNDYAGLSISSTPIDTDRFSTQDFPCVSTSFDFQPPFSLEMDLRSSNKFGPSPCLILNALTMTNASDGINLERLETVGDSFLKYAVTMFLFCSYQSMHEGKLSYLRSKQVSNYNLYKLGRRKGIGELMVASKFEPSDNWLPPAYSPLDKNNAAAGGPNNDPTENKENVDPLRKDVEEADRLAEAVLEDETIATPPSVELIDGQPVVTSSPAMTVELLKPPGSAWVTEYNSVVPYNLLTQHSIPDKSVADAVEALIGVYLLTYGPKGALTFMKWLGLKILPDGFDYFQPPCSPLLNYVKDPEQSLRRMWMTHKFAKFEEIVGYTFQDKAYVVQSFTHASYFYNRITDCYQRLEFLGDAVLDYLITRHLYEDKRQHSPGVLTDLRSALVNNTIFASLAVKWNFHKFFLAICPGLHMIISKFVEMQEQRHGEANFDELYLINEEDVDDEEDIEVPKSLGDVFESVAGAIYLDSGCSLDAVWRVYYALMKDQIEKCCANPPKSPIRELLEMEPEKVKFAKMERIITTQKVRVSVDVYGKGRFTGMGRNYRIAKCTAAKRALKYLKSLKLQQPQQDRSSSKLATVAK